MCVFFSRLCFFCVSARLQRLSAYPPAGLPAGQPDQLNHVPPPLNKPSESNKVCYCWPLLWRPPPPKTHSAYSAFEICSSFCKILPIHSYGDIFNQCIQQFHSKSPQLSAFIFFTNTHFLVKILIQTASSVCLITCDLPDTCVAYSIFAWITVRWLIRGFIKICQLQAL